MMLSDKCELEDDDLSVTAFQGAGLRGEREASVPTARSLPEGTGGCPAPPSSSPPPGTRGEAAVGTSGAGPSPDASPEHTLPWGLQPAGLREMSLPFKVFDLR